MASIRLQQPEAFDFRAPDEWTTWKRRFQQFRYASGLSTEDELRQVSTLLYCLGEEADDVLTSTNISAGDRTNYDAVMRKFDDHFQVRRNIIFERAKFNRRNQLEGESAELYITALYALVETCNYGDLREEMLRDRIVVGIRDARLSERLQLDADLTLEKAKKTVRQKEAVSEQQVKLQGAGTKKDPILIHEMQRKLSRGGVYSGRKETKKEGSHKHQPQQCIRCGADPHQKGDKCPALGATCHKCGRKGHYSSRCLGKRAATTHELSLDTAYLGTMTTSRQVASWHATIRLGSKNIPFKVDTGAEVTAISEATFKTLKKVTLRKASMATLSGCHTTRCLLTEVSDVHHFPRRRACHPAAWLRPRLQACRRTASSDPHDKEECVAAVPCFRQWGWGVVLHFLSALESAASAHPHHQAYGRPLLGLPEECHGGDEECKPIGSSQVTGYL